MSGGRPRLLLNTSPDCRVIEILLEDARAAEGEARDALSGSCGLTKGYSNEKCPAETDSRFLYAEVTTGFVVAIPRLTLTA